MWGDAQMCELDQLPDLGRERFELVVFQFPAPEPTHGVSHPSLSHLAANHYREG